MKNIKPAWLLAALVICWISTPAAQGAAKAKVPAKAAAARSQLDEFKQRAEAWADDQKVFTATKFERWEKQFKSEAEFRQWLAALFPDYLEEEKDRQGRGEGPMDESVFGKWLSAKVLEKVHSRSLFELLASGGVLMIPLLICSIVGITFALLRAFEYRREILFPPSLMRIKIIFLVPVPLG